MKDLPSVFQNEINHKINNDQEVFNSSKDRNVKMKKNISIRDIDKLLNDRNHISKMNVKVFLKSGSVLNKQLISRDDNYAIFMDNTKILISDIEDILKD